MGDGLAPCDLSPTATALGRCPWGVSRGEGQSQDTAMVARAQHSQAQGQGTAVSPAPQQGWAEGDREGGQHREGGIGTGSAQSLGRTPRGGRQ